MNLSGNKCIVTRGAGFIGSHLIDALAGDGRRAVHADLARRGAHARPAHGAAEAGDLAHCVLVDLHAAREIASGTDPIPVGILYRNPEVPCYEETRHAGQLTTAGRVRGALEAELDKYTVWPQQA